jgi:hypothetical protein
MTTLISTPATKNKMLARRFAIGSFALCCHFCAKRTDYSAPLLFMKECKLAGLLSFRLER